MQPGRISPTPLTTAPIYSRISVLATACPWHLITAEDIAFCWRERAGSVWFALGKHAEFDTPTQLQTAVRRVQSLDSDLMPRGFGIVAFDPARPPREPWRDFSVRNFILPECLVRWQDGKATVLALSTSHDELAQTIRRVTTSMSHPAHALTHSQELTDERETFSREAWRRAIEMAHRLMQHGDLQKIVLARQTALDFFGEPNPASVLEALAEETHASTVFAYRQRNAGVFLGATPERLFTLNRRHVTVDSLAGTRPRGTGEAEDNRFAEDLAGSEKDLLEQQFVTDHVVLQLQSLCDDVIIESAPRIRKLEAVQHLATIVEGTARDGTTLDQILFALHPTPATCGSPIAIARDLIAEWEPQPRGLYAGTIGWVGAQQAEFVVAIRAGLIRRDKARLFAGAGIVRASDADNEYDECEWKMLPLRRAILNQRR